MTVETKEHPGQKTLMQYNMTDRELEIIGAYIEKQFGIRVQKSKRYMLQARLAKRLKTLGFSDYLSYFDYIINGTGRNEEYFTFIDLISTHKTHFFREAEHFRYLYHNILPQYDFLNIWSAACSTGEEPYSIAMTIQDYRESQSSRTPDFSILGTDLSVAVLEKALRAIYKKDCLEGIPAGFIKKYLMKNKDPNTGTIRIVPELRQTVRFKQLNLMSPHYVLGRKMDIIFCRNVLIYFKRETQDEIISRMIEHLNPGGYLFIGHTESLLHWNWALKNVYPTVYRKL